MTATLLRYRRPVVIAFHVTLFVISNYLAFWLRFDGVIAAREWAVFQAMLPWLVLSRVVTFFPFRLYEGLWRYTGIWDLSHIILAVVTSTAIFSVIVRAGFGLVEYPRSIFILDSLVLICLMGGSRLSRRIRREMTRRKGQTRVLIFGAGDAGEMIVRDMQKNPSFDYDPVGFVDDDPRKIGQRIHGVRVLGSREDLPDIITAQRPHEVLVAMPRADASVIRGVVKALEPFKTPITTLPKLEDILDGRLAVSQIRSLSIEDLLPRAPVGLDTRNLRTLLEGRRVMVTGAGGSIGSELCRQIAALRPELLVMYERYENSLYAIETELADKALGIRLQPVLGDVTDRARLDGLLAAVRPHVVFHAAAHKHVPLVEANVCEAVKNNVIGTRTVAEAAGRHGVERFILISTDKAVNPSSVMGATKRVAELTIQTIGGQSGTCYAAVRFGNVLGSNGSVVPRFLDQIKAGGPVTVTHPQMRRYFMLISEAVQLVLQAASLGQGGTLYVLDMGEQVKLVDLARNLIRLSGFVPEQDIPITYTGPRPGEKLWEELVGEEEVVEPSGAERILRVRSLTTPDAATLAAQLAKLERLAIGGLPDPVIEQLCRMVPSFRRQPRIVVAAGAASSSRLDAPAIAAAAAGGR